MLNLLYMIIVKYIVKIDKKNIFCQVFLFKNASHRSSGGFRLFYFKILVLGWFKDIFLTPFCLENRNSRSLGRSVSQSSFQLYFNWIYLVIGVFTKKISSLSQIAAKKFTFYPQRYGLIDRQIKSIIEQQFETIVFLILDVVVFVIIKK